MRRLLIAPVLIVWSTVPAGAQETEPRAETAVATEGAESSAADDEPTEPEEDAETERRRRRSPTTTAREPTPLFLRSPSGHQSLEFGMFLSTTLSVHLVEPPADGGDGFMIDNARLAFWGDLYEDFEYVLQAELARIEQPLLDMMIAWEPYEQLRLSVGLFKTPFSAEFILSAANIPLQRRAQVVRALAPNRQAGFQLSGRIADGRLTYAVGVFNGTTFDEPDALANVDNDFLYVGRVGSELEPKGDLRIELGVNAAGGREDDLRYAFVSADPFGGGRLLLGADASLHWRGLLLSTEWVAGRIDPSSSAMLAVDEPGWVWGFHATAGYSFVEYLAAYVRWDHFDTTAFAAALGDGEPRDLLVLSVASGTRGAAPVGAQIDVIVPVRDTDGTELLINVLAVF